MLPKFMWPEILGEFSDLYSVHIFSRIDVHAIDAILVCTGALLGMPPEAGGEWKMIGGATHESPATPGSRKLELHPLF